MGGATGVGATTTAGAALAGAGGAPNSSPRAVARPRRSGSCNVLSDGALRGASLAADGALAMPGASCGLSNRRNAAIPAAAPTSRIFLKRTSGLPFLTLQITPATPQPV